jgi:hypothetical protein
MSCRTEPAEAAVGMGGAAGLPAEGGPGAAERVVRRDAENESTAAVLHADDKAGGRVIYGIGRLGMSFTAVEGDRVVAELQRQSGAISVTAGHTEACHEWRARADCVEKTDPGFRRSDGLWRCAPSTMTVLVVVV